MIADEVSISVETYTTVLEKENLGEPHTTLGGGERWYPPDEQRNRDVRVLNELRQQGLVDGTRITGDFMETVTIMQRPSLEYYTYATVDGTAVRIRTAASGRDALLIFREGSTITISPIPAEQLGVRLAAALPETPAAHLHSMSCDGTDLQVVMNDKRLPQSGSVRDAKRMKRWLEMEQTHSGHLYAAVRDGLGGRTSSQAPLPVWFDTESGRLLFSPAANGWFNLAGADLLTITRKLEDLEKRLR